jgi:hypothetical protein
MEPGQDGWPLRSWFSRVFLVNSADIGVNGVDAQFRAPRYLRSRFGTGMSTDPVVKIAALGTRENLERGLRVLWISARRLKQCLVIVHHRSHPILFESAGIERNFPAGAAILRTDPSRAW